MDLHPQAIREKEVTIQVKLKIIIVCYLMKQFVNSFLCVNQLLQDENATLQLEIGKIDERMKDLERENGQLLQRWLKKMNEEAEKMNEANQFYERFVRRYLEI